MTVIHVLWLTPVQVHPLVVVTAAVCDPPAVITLCVVGAMLKLHAPAWVTVAACPAIVSVPVRGLVAVFAATVYATVPFPVPLPPLVTVIQDALLAPVQAQPVVVVTAVVNDPPAAAAVCAFGEIVKLQIPLCVTVSVCPAIVSVPVRGLVAVFAPTEYATVPFPVPLSPLVTVIQDALLTPVHAQPVVVVTAVVNDPPPAAAGCAVDERVKLHVPLCVTVSVCPAIVSVPVRGVDAVRAATL